ncbi:MAG TPA: hypothetical protein VIK04_07260 [Solirubrobacteraceae bacterium]
MRLRPAGWAAYSAKSARSNSPIADSLRVQQATPAEHVCPRGVA